MFYKHLVVSFLFFLTQYVSIAQSELVINPLPKAEIAFLDFISRDSTNDLNLIFFKENFRFGVPLNRANGISLLKKKDQIYLQLMGSGRLYQVKKEGTSRYQLIRLDSTLHSGVNFGTINFFHKDTLIQFGGLGFWGVKDHFTFFSQKTHEWEFYNANKRVPVYLDNENGVFFKMDDVSNKFYLSNTIYQKDFPNTLSISKGDSCLAFDFNTRQWTILGKLNPSLHENTKRSVDLKTSYGNYLLFHTDLVMYWLNFATNQYGTISKDKQTEYREKWLKLYKGNPKLMFQFVMGANFYLIRIENDGQLTYETITLNDKNFVDENAQPIYTNSFFTLLLRKIEPGRPILGNLFILLLFTLLYTLYNKRFKTKRIPNEVLSILYKNFYSSLTIIEKELIQSIYQHQIKNEQISIKTINKIIGVQQKDTITQNKSRSDIFLRINQKFKLATRENDPLIVKQREETDKRQYNYNVNLVFIKQLEKLILNNQ